MSSLEKTVKLACKPKAAPPKNKYLEPIIAATWDEGGAISDVCRALQPRFKEPNAIVVFKALIVLHTMMRSGNTDNTLAYLSSSEVLHLRNVAAGSVWEGYHAPQNMQHYAIYLDARIRAYRELKHDAIAVQSEHNRDLRLERELGHAVRPSSRRKTVEEDAPTGGSAPGGGLKRSKTLAGRKLRVMTVEKGLLRETKAVQKQIDTLVECRFYLDDLEDPLTLTSLRMLVQDLLILFSAGNEGVINVLENYFEMSRVDAEGALTIYKHFCKQCEQVVEFLGVAKKLQNILNVQIPNMKHAPVSLAGALKEYLDDPNFEQNRIEYKLQKQSADKNARSKKSSNSSEPVPPLPSSPAAGTSSAPASAAASKAPVPGTMSPAASQNVADFFESIEQVQQPMFGAQGAAPQVQVPMQTGFNPFMQMQATGAPFGASPFGQVQQQQPFAQPMQQQQPFAQPMQQQQQQQPFLQPQATGFNPFAQQMQQQQQQPSSPFGNMLAPQQQQPTGFLQPQITGGNPFRTSMLMPQMTGMAAFGTGPMAGMGGAGNNPFPQQQQQQGPMGGQPYGQTNGNSLFVNGGGQVSPGPLSAANSMSSAFSTNTSTTSGSNPFPFLSNGFGAQQQQQQQPNGALGSSIQRPGSAPLTTLMPKSASPPPQLAAVKTHQTGSRNPFGPVVTPAPPVPKVPTMAELLGLTPSGGMTQVKEDKTGFAAFEARHRAQQDAAANGTGGNAPSNGGAMSGVASSFSFGGMTALSPQATSTTSDMSRGSSLFSLSTQPTGATVTSTGAPSITFSSAGMSPIQPQATGFGGVKPFKPSSSFGASLMDTLPSIPASAPTTPGESGGANGANGLAGGFGAMSLGSGPSAPASGTSSLMTNSPFGALNTQMTGMPSLGMQQTGGASLFGATSSMAGAGLRPQMTGAAGVANPFRASMFGATPTGGGMGGAPGMAASASSPTGSTGLGGSNVPAFQPSSGFGASLFGMQQPNGQQQQAQQQGSLI